MSRILVENQLEFDFRRAASSVKFDEPARHGLTHCMSSVDFIVEDARRVLYIEVKDLDNPVIPEKNRTEFLAKLKSGALVSSSLVPKARDSFLYNHLQDRLPPGKPLLYIVLIACKVLNAVELDLISTLLRAGLPLYGPGTSPWKRSYFSACLAMNVDSWNRSLPEFPVRRV